MTRKVTDLSKARELVCIYNITVDFENQTNLIKSLNKPCLPVSELHATEPSLRTNPFEINDSRHWHILTCLSWSEIRKNLSSE